MLKRLQSVQDSSPTKDSTLYSFRQSVAVSGYESGLNETKPVEGRFYKVFKLNIPALFEQNWFGPRLWKSKLYDGILPALVMILLTLLFNLLFIPVKIVFGTPGLLIYTLIILAGGFTH